ncbi:zinc-ribbon domain-containing protein [Pseudoalteromonas rhizosphaerae]|uniref:zinc-ribbon domain-containing protein n=1 Tax=Pseudoalteromonas rhizosphaerae TaxID=2518973 RepID=UPI0021490237|nr:zinc-ribbon domain-containing protein [Pseudoalteromonas rhizosphaerae]
MTNYVNHPKYGSEPILSGNSYTKQEIDNAHWRYASLRYFPETATPAAIEKQSYCVYPRQLYVDIEEQCVDCHRAFIFFAKEQQYWFEELKFWIDAHAIKCFECRKKSRAINQLQIIYANLIIKEHITLEETQLLKSSAQQLFESGVIKKINKINAIRKM